MGKLYRINDAMTALAAEFGIDTSTDEVCDKLDEITHQFAEMFGISQGTSGYCIVCTEPSDEPGVSALCAYHRDTQS